MPETDVTTVREHPGLHRDGKGKFDRSVEVAERDAQACRLKRDGHTYDYIARHMGYSDRSAARQAVQRGMLAVVQEAGEEVRQLELMRLDNLWVKALGVMEGTHWTVQNGRVVTINVGTKEDPEYVPVPDSAPVLAAIGKLLDIQARRAKLLGLDSPKRIEVLSIDLLDAQISQLRAKMELANAAKELTQ